MLDFFIQIPGPTFLVYYGFFTFMVMLAMYLSNIFDGTLSCPIPEPTIFSPLEIAILRQGIRGATIFSMYTLLWKKAVEIQTFTSSKKILIAAVPNCDSKMSDVELTIYNYATDNPKYYRHYYSPGMLKSIDSAIIPLVNNLVDHKLIINSKTENRYKWIFGIGFALILSIGIVRICFGIINGNPLGFLILSIIIYSILLLWLFNPMKHKRTALGNRFLKQCKRRFKWLTNSMNRDQLKIDKNILYTIATFGALKKYKEAIGDDLKIPYDIENSSAKNFLHPSRVTSYGKGCAGCAGGKSYKKVSGSWWAGCGSGCSGGCSSGCGSGCGGGCGG